MKTVIPISENCTCELLFSLTSIKEKKLRKQERETNRIQRAKMQSWLNAEKARRKAIHCVNSVNANNKDNFVTKMQSDRSVKGLSLKEYRHQYYLKTVALGWRHY